MFQKLSYHWGLVQGTLFPSLKAKPELSEMTRMHQRLIALVEVVRVEKFIKSFEGCVGRPERDRCPIARAFIAKTLYNVGETKLFIEFLTNDSILRRICGWENKRNIPVLSQIPPRDEILLEFLSFSNFKHDYSARA